MVPSLECVEHIQPFVADERSVITLLRAITSWKGYKVTINM